MKAIPKSTIIFDELDGNHGSVNGLLRPPGTSKNLLTAGLLPYDTESSMPYAERDGAPGRGGVMLESFLEKKGGMWFSVAGILIIIIVLLAYLVFR